MFSKWKKTDIFLLFLFLAAAISYLFLSRDTFRTFLWLFGIVAFIRILNLISRKLLWKIRDRLIVSSLFFTVTPIFLITIFFLLILYIIIYQYNTVIFENVMNTQNQSLERMIDNFFGAQDPDKILAALQRMNPARESVRNIVFFQKKDGRFQERYRSHSDLSFEKVNIAELAADFNAGYFKLDNRLYHGVLKIENDMAFFVFVTIDQHYFDHWPEIGDFKIMFIDPAEQTIRKTPKGISMELESSKFRGFGKYRFPWPYTYRYRDLDSVRNGKADVKFNLFLLINDYSKIFQKLKSSDRTIVISRELRKAQDELNSTAKPEGKRLLLKKIDELHKEMDVLSKKDPYAAAFPVSYVVIFMIGLFGFFLVISLFIGFRIVRVITKSVNELTKGTEKIRKGDFSYRIRIKSQDQMHDLAESFNEMASGIDRLLIEEKDRERLEEELRIARTVQLKLLPPDSFSCDQFEIAAVNIPAQEIAGDYFDYHYHPDEFLSVLVADVSGKGA
jgi:HAMP domain-containing protein